MINYVVRYKERLLPSDQVSRKYSIAHEGDDTAHKHVLEGLGMRKSRVRERERALEPLYPERERYL